VNAINARLDAIASLHDYNELMGDLSQLFSKLPDLERMLARCHSGTMSLLEFLRLLDALDEVKARRSLITLHPRLI
jgi:DNA mismatch repair protein MSH6